MKRHGIPTAHYQTFTNAAAAHDYIDQKGAPIVIKADGLAAGKGVVVAMSLPEAHMAVDMMLSDNKLLINKIKETLFTKAGNLNSAITRRESFQKSDLYKEILSNTVFLKKRV